jgi:hypothetical protein
MSNTNGEADSNSDPTRSRLFTGFGRMLHWVAISGLSKSEIRNMLVKHCETDDLLVLIDVFDDLLAKSQKGEKDA